MNNMLSSTLARRAPPPCAQRSFNGPRGRLAAGFTIIELLVVIGIAGVLSSVAYPSFVGQLQKARRADVLVAMLHVQVAQERWRSNNARYGSMSDIAVPNASMGGHYTLQINSNSESGYDVLAVAGGAQSRDSACRQMKMSVTSAQIVYASGPDAAAANPAAVNRQCWIL